MSNTLAQRQASSGRLGSFRRRLVALVATGALGAGMLVTLSVAQAPTAAAATNDLSVVVTAARTVNQGAGFVQAGDPVPHYSYLLQKIDVGNERDAITNCLPPSNNTATTTYDPQYPNKCQWPGTRLSNSGGDTIISSGTEADIANVTNLADGKYIISVKADGFEVGGANFTMPITAPVQVKLQSGPLPLATVRVRVYQDSAPVDGTYEIDAEQGIPGFRGFLSDMLGDVSTDFFGNPLCTSYVHDAPDAQHPAGPIHFTDGSPDIAPDSIGKCISDANGDIVIPNMAPGRYGITVRPSADHRNWYQTTTLEGAQDHDWWVMAGDTGYGAETTYGSEPVPEVQFGFVPPRTTADALPAPTNNPAVLSALGTAAIHGSMHEGCHYIGSPGGQVANAVPGVNGPETMDCGVIKNGIVAVSALDLGDQLVATEHTNADGTYTVPKLADGNYMLAFFDDAMTHILETANVTITDGQDEQMGVTYISAWFAKVQGYVFIDTNGNGRRDPGEPGVAKTPLTVRERDNTPMDQFTNAIDTDANGHYTIDQTYPLARYIVLEHFDPRYRPTAMTSQSCNDPKPHTYTGSAVDISVLPVLGLCATVDWAVEPLKSGETGGIAGTVTYGTTRNELDASQAATENWQPGIPNVPVHLYAELKNPDGTPQLLADGSYKHGPELQTPYLSESYARPSGCTALDRLGKPLTTQTALPAPGDPALSCPESNMYGTQAAPADATPGNDAQTVQGNYGFSSSNKNLIDPAAPGYDPTDPNNPKDDAGNPLALYAPLDGSTLTPPQAYKFAEQPLKAGDYIVSAEILPDAYGKPMYKVTKEEDVNIFSGDSFLPQENMPPATPDAGVAAPTPTPGTGITSGLGENNGCVGPNHTVNVTNPDFLAGGGSPFEGKPMPLCTDKLVNVNDASTGSTNFELFTDVPLATHFWGLIINDLGVQTDPSSLGYDEAEGLKNVPTGIYDWAGNLIDTAVSDRNGFYEAVVPSSDRINNPSPTGVSPGMYRFVGNDPGQPGHLNPDYDSRYRTIATNFQAWPGLWTVTDTAPQASASTTFNGGMTLTKCDVSTAEPQLFAVDTPVATAAGSLTLTGRDFGDGSGISAVLLGAPNDAAADPDKATRLSVTSWSGTSITVQVPAASASFAPGPRQLLVRAANGKVTSNGITLHVIGTAGTASYTPTVFEVGPARAYDTNNGGTLQAAITDAAAKGAGASTLVVAYPQVPTATTPRGEYAENPVLSTGVKVQGVGAGGFQADGTWVPGSIITGEAFAEGSPTGTAWMSLVAGLSNAVPSVIVPDAATITVITPAGGTGAAKPSIDGFTITGGHEQDVTSNINVITGGTKTPYGAAGVVITQGGGVYVHGGSDGLSISNNVITGNSGSYAGGIRIGTPFVNGNIGQNDVGATPLTNYTLTNTHLTIAHNRVLHNGGTNLAGGVGIFSGTPGYRLAYNDVCGNFSAEYGGGISQYGLSRQGRIDHNRLWFNESYDEGGAIMLAGELTLNPSDLSGGTGEVSVDNNRIAQNLGNDDGGGLRLLNAGNWKIKIENNELTDNVSTHEGGGVALNNASNVVLDNNTIASNVTTATAITSNGSPAPAGVATSALDAMLASTLPPGSPTFTRPVAFNNIFWDNRAGYYDGSSVHGIGGAGDPAAINLWDIGSQDSSGLVPVDNSILTTFDGTTSSTGSPGTNVSADPAFVKKFTIDVTVDVRRAFGLFRQTAITNMLTNPWDNGNFGITAGSPAVALGAISYVSDGVTYPAPQFDIDGRVRFGHVDSGATQFGDAASVPGAPTGVTVTPGNTRLTVGWTAPVVTGGRVLGNYTVNAYAADTGGSPVASCVTAGLTCDLTGLANGTTYWVDVTASNTFGDSTASAPRVQGIPATRPDAPTGVVVTGKPLSLGVSWNASVDGGSPVTGYTATAYASNTPRLTIVVAGQVIDVGPNPAYTQVVGTPCTTTGALACTITGLTAGQQGWVSVTATNLVGTSDASAPRQAGTATIVPTAPAAPTNVVAARGNGQAVVTWTAPNANGSPITGYTATAYTSSNIANTTTAGTACSTATLTCTITGLTNGTTYYVSVTATNGVGTGPASTPRAQVTPATVPTVSGVVVTPRNAGATRQLAVTWTAVNGGAAVFLSTVRVFSAASGGTQVTSCTVFGAGTSCTAPGFLQAALAPATNYWVTVEATNIVGASGQTARLATRTL